MSDETELKETKLQLEEWKRSSERAQGKIASLNALIFNRDERARELKLKNDKLATERDELKTALTVMTELCSNTMADLDGARDDILMLESSLNDLTERIDNMTKHREEFILCAYCGVDTKEDFIAEHIAHCAEHPLYKERAAHSVTARTADRLQRELDAAKEELERLKAVPHPGVVT